jgi:hypothetical protein
MTDNFDFARYRKRFLVETKFSVLKRRYGADLKSRIYQIQKKEISCKIILANLDRFIQIVWIEVFYRAVITNTLCDSKPYPRFYIESTSGTKESMVSPAIGALSSRFDEFRPLIAGIQYYVFTDLGDPHTGNAIAATLGFPATKSDGTAVMVTCGHGNPGKSDTSFKEPSNSAYQPNVDDDYKYGNVGDRTLANLDASYHTFASGISASAKIYDKKWAEDDHKVPILKYTNTPIDPKDKVTVSGRSSDQIDMDYVEFCTSSVLSEAIYEGDHNAPGCIYDKESKKWIYYLNPTIKLTYNSAYGPGRILAGDSGAPAYQYVQRTSDQKKGAQVLGIIQGTSLDGKYVFLTPVESITTKWQLTGKTA